MYKNFLKTGIRSLLRHKGHSVINISGLALGIACCLLIFLVVRYELSYDAFHTKADRIYRVNTKSPREGYLTTGAPIPVAKAMKQDFPEVEQAASVLFMPDGLIKVNQQLYKEKGIAYVAPEYFSVLDVNWLIGNPQKALSEPNTVVLTKSLAQKYFGGPGSDLTRTAIGKTIRFNTDFTLTVTGIVEDFPANTDLPFNILLSWSSLKVHIPDLPQNTWENILGNVNHFVLLRPGTDPAQVEAKFPAFDKKHKGDEEAAKRTQMLQPLQDMHYDDRFSNYNGRTMTKANIGGLVLIGAFILLIACINFINLATAQSVKRSKEVGVRKVLGADRSQLVRQFLSETSLLSFTAMLIAVMLTFMLVPQLQNLLELGFTFNPFTDWQLLAFLLGITLLVALLAGLYPAFALSGYQPVTALKNKITLRGGAVSLRRSLIVVQFVVAQVLIISTIVVSGQLEYFRSKPLGFNKDAVITLQLPPPNNPETARSLRGQLDQIPGVKNVSLAIMAPSSEGQWWSGFTHQGDPKEYYSLQIPIDHTYLQTYGLSLVAGQNPGPNTDSSHVLINEQLVRWLNISSPQAAIGHQLTMDGKRLQIVGVVKDFHTNSLHRGINGVLMRKVPQVGIAGIKIEPASMRATIAQIGQVWKRTYPDSLFEPRFLDETIANFYREEVKMFKLFRIFAGITIFISCLGLYGLVSFMAVQRTKEIGIRKVLGAPMGHIVGLFTKEFIALIVVAFAVAAPLAWYAMDAWLQGFENRLPLGAGSFLMAILLSIAVAGITIGYQSVRAATANPVKALRSE